MGGPRFCVHFGIGQLKRRFRRRTDAARAPPEREIRT
jgi:hypothetical protein